MTQFWTEEKVKKNNPPQILLSDVFNKHCEEYTDKEFIGVFIDDNKDSLPDSEWKDLKIISDTKITAKFSSVIVDLVYNDGLYTFQGDVDKEIELFYNQFIGDMNNTENLRLDIQSKGRYEIISEDIDDQSRRKHAIIKLLKNESEEDIEYTFQAVSEKYHKNNVYLTSDKIVLIMEKVETGGGEIDPEPEEPVEPPIEEGEEYIDRYFCVEPKENYTLRIGSSYRNETFYYSYNDEETWKLFPYETGINVKNGDIIKVKCDMKNGLDSSGLQNREEGYFHSIFDISMGKSDLSGNVNSLIHGDDFKTNLNLKEYALDLFFNGLNVIDCSNLVIPYKKIPNQALSRMFAYCSELVSAPNLDYIEEIEHMGMSGMFVSCKKLLKAPVLKAKKYGVSCCVSMFAHCSSLTETPSFDNFVNLEGAGCFDSMFDDCTSLRKITTILPATTLTTGCYQNMFHDCTSLVDIPEDLLPATELEDSCYLCMFNGCESLSKTCKLPAKTLKNNCYLQMWGYTAIEESPEMAFTDMGPNIYAFHSCAFMFINCKNLKKIKCLAENEGIEKRNYTERWVEGVAEKGVFYKPYRTIWNVGTYGIPEGWEVVNLGDIDYSLYAGENIKNHPFYDEYFTIESVDERDWTFKFADGVLIEGISYSLSGGEWQSFPEDGVLLKKNESIRLKRKNSTVLNIIDSISEGHKSIFNTNMRECKIYGNINSMYAGDDFMTTVETYPYMFAGWFRHVWCKDYSNLVIPYVEVCNNGLYRMFYKNDDDDFKLPGILPALKIGESAYEQMFCGCTSLTDGTTIISALEMGEYAMREMFMLCEKMEKTCDILPSLTLSQYCYADMYFECSKLKRTPELPAENLVYMCYVGMFAECYELNYVKCLAKELGYEVSQNWLVDTAETGTFVKSAALEDYPRDENGIPEGWVVENV